MQHESEHQTDFYNSISYESLFHDMKTPLTLMYASLLELETSDYLNDTVQRPINDIKKNWFRIMKIINDSCDLHKMSVGKMLPIFKNCDIVSLVGSIAESTRLLTARKNISVVFDSSMKSKIVAVDKDILDRILLNLLSNSIKFTDVDGSIILNLKEDMDKKNIIITIRDNGKGIKREDIQKVHEKYFKDMSPYNKSGSGLGLYIVKGLVAILGGDLIINYKDTGAEVVVKIPCVEVDVDTDDRKYFDDFHSDNIVQIELSDDY